MAKRAIFDASTGVTSFVDDEEVSYANEDILFLKEAKKQEMSKACEAAIVDNFHSSVVVSSTGQAHIYGVDRDDQKNMDSKLMILYNTPLKLTQHWKTKDSGIVLHTREEFIAVVLEIAEHIENCIFRNVMKKELIDIATTVEEINAINW